MSRTLLRSLFSFDARPTSEVEDEMRAEFDAHLAMLEDELTQQGLDPVTARAQALARFGDPQRLSREGKAIKLGDRIMLQRINLALLIVIGAAVIFLLVQNQRISSRSVATLEQVTASLAAIQSKAESPAPWPVPRKILIEGEVEKPGAYTVPPRGMTLKELIAAAGGLKDTAKTVYYDNPDGTQQDRVFSASDLDAWVGEMQLAVNDVISITAEEDQRAPAHIPVDVRGYVRSPGKSRIIAKGASLARLLESNQVEPEARAVRIERSGAEPMSKTLNLGEALAEVGRNTPILAGDVVTVVGPEGEAPTANGWKKYELPQRVAELMAGDRDLVNLVETRRTLDSTAEKMLQQGYPLSHRGMVSLRVDADRMQNRIAARTRELLKPELDRFAQHDDDLKNLLEERAKLEEGITSMPRKSVSRGSDEWTATMLRADELDAHIMSRFEELAKAEKK